MFIASLTYTTPLSDVDALLLDLDNILLDDSHAAVFEQLSQ